MNALLVGADRLGNIPGVLAEFGIRIGGHVTGRQPGHQKRATVPAGTELVILFTDYLGHNVMRTFRDTARAQGLPVVLPTLDEQPAADDCRVDRPAHSGLRALFARLGGLLGDAPGAVETLRPVGEPHVLDPDRAAGARRVNEA
jgi:hypothetical protein